MLVDCRPQVDYGFFIQLGASRLRTLSPKAYTLNPKPQSLYPKPSTLLDPKRCRNEVGFLHWGLYIHVCMHYPCYHSYCTCIYVSMYVCMSACLCSYLYVQNRQLVNTPEEFLSYPKRCLGTSLLLQGCNGVWLQKRFSFCSSYNNQTTLSQIPRTLSQNPKALNP